MPSPESSLSAPVFREMVQSPQHRCFRSVVNKITKNLGGAPARSVTSSVPCRRPFLLDTHAEVKGTLLLTSRSLLSLLPLVCFFFWSPGGILIAMALPAQLRAIQHHLRTANEHEKRDPVVAYYCRLYAMQTGMKLDSKTPECRKFLVKLMDQLETMKKELSDNDSISQEVVGNAHIENYALKMFLYADNEDRSGRFHKNMIKSFYTASLLLDVLSVFGELSEENIQHRKYARWKATYIHNCLKSGETPQAGPIGMDEDEGADEYGAEGFSGPGLSHGGSFRGGPPSQFEDHDPSLDPGPAPGIGFTPSPESGASGPPTINYNNIHIPPGAHAPANTPAELPPPSAEAVKPVPLPRSVPTVDPTLLNAQQQGGVHLTAEDYTKAQKYCKYAGSALQYEDVSTAVQNLQKALKLLTTGKE